MRILLKAVSSLLIVSTFFFFAQVPLALAAAVTVNHHTASTGPNTTQTSLSFSFDDTGDNYLVIYLQFRGVVTGVACTYNSVSMAQLGTAAPSTLAAGYAFGLANPTTGANTLACSWTGAAFIAYTVASVSGYVSLGTVDVESSSASPASITVTGTLGANDLLFGAMGGDNTSPNFSVTTGTTLDSTSGTTAQGAIDGYNTGTGSKTVVFGIVGADSVVAIGVPILGAAAAAATPSILFLIRAKLL